jgi:hypothetical protein
MRTNGFKVVKFFLTANRRLPPCFGSAACAATAIKTEQAANPSAIPAPVEVLNIGTILISPARF